MKITIFIGGLSRGGAERVTCNLANSLVCKGHEVTVLTMSDEAAAYPLRDGVEQKVLIRQSERRSFAYNAVLRFLRFCKYLRHEQPDVYIVMLPITTIMLLQLRRLTKAKVIAAERNNPASYAKKKQRALRRLARRADGWVFQTEKERTWYGDAVGRADVVTIPNAINPDFIQPPFGGSRRKIIVSVGRMSPQKNQALLVRAFAAIAGMFMDYRLVIYGEGEKRRELQALANQLEVADRVDFPGYATNIGEKIQDAALFVLPSDFEGMPNSLMEAMALGLPCIATDCDGGGARFLIDNEKNGLLVPKGDVEALAGAMRRMLGDRGFAEQCGHEAHNICERLAPERVYGQWEQFIKEVVKA